MRDAIYQQCFVGDKRVHLVRIRSLGGLGSAHTMFFRLHFIFSIVIFFAAVFSEDGDLPKHCYKDYTAGDCVQKVEMWYYEHAKDLCGKIPGGGCVEGAGQDVNRFLSEADCHHHCGLP